MRKIFYSILALSAITLCSCDDFLNENPKSDITGKPSTGTGELVSDYKTADDAKGVLNGAYAKFKFDIYELLNFVIGDCMSDNCYIGSDGPADEEYGKLSITPTNVNVKNSWAQYYAIAGSATSVIENTKLMKSTAISDTERARIIAEAKFIRAWAYFDIVRLWGDAPMSLKLIPSITADNLDEWYPEIYPERTPADKIYAQILEDLNETTISSLETSSVGIFKATKGAAHGLKAKVLATRGEKNTRDYNAVIAECDNVLAQGYRLVGDFESLWTVAGKLSSEGIFELYFDATTPNWAYWCLLTEVSGDIQVTWRRYCAPTHDILKKFDKEKDQRYKSSIVWHEVPYNQHYPASNYPLAYKIRQKDNNIILMRLADILLLKAEALVEINQPDKAIAIVNDIRTRAGVGSLNTAMSQADARLAVENERQLELLLEGHRWYDLVRNDRWEAVMEKARDKNGNIRFPKVDSFKRILPIPQGQIDVNERITQNKGY